MTRYISTRGPGPDLSFLDVMLAGLAPDGGLYVPESWPSLGEVDTGRYADTALHVLNLFAGGTIAPDALASIVERIYNPALFESPAIVPLRQVADRLHVLELFHGPTLAFKDMALLALGQMFDHVLEQSGQRLTIVGATSGDTGSAAIEACRPCRNIDIFILYPHGRVSEVQRRQMTTVASPNVHTIAVEGTFDDCQAFVKAMFADEAFRREVNLSAVNSINWARIAAQVAYYVHAAGGDMDSPVTYSVPTGNFGNVYAGYAARQMGLPVRRLVVGSNRNDILTRFFETGTMRVEGVSPSLSPSMDIQVSSNFERYLFDVLGRDSQTLRGLMDAFRQDGAFTLEAGAMAQARADFFAARCDDAQTLETIRAHYAETGVLIDPHSAVGLHAAYAYMQSGQYEGEEVVSLACAHPAKFPDAVERATGVRPALPERLGDLMDRAERINVLPRDLAGVQRFIRERRR